MIDSDPNNMKENWIEICLEEIVPTDGIFCDGDWVESKDQDPNGEVRLIQLADIGDGYFVDKSDRHLTKKRANELNCTFLEQNDLLIARMPDPLGRACIFPFQGRERYVTVVDVCVIRLGSEYVSNKYLMYLINSPEIRTKIEALQSGSTRKRISRRNLAGVKIPMPPLNEQKRIVTRIEELFSELDKGIENLKTAREQLKLYRQAVLKHAFEGKLTAAWRERNRVEFRDWKSVCVKDVATVGTGATPKRGEKKYYDNGIHPWITSGALNDEYVKESIELITELALIETNCKLFQPGTILVAMYGEGKTRGKASILNIQAATNQACAAITITDKRISLNYLWNFFKYNYENIRLHSSGGVQPNLNLSHIKNILFPLPSLAEQHAINEIIEIQFSQAKYLADEIGANIEKSETLRQSILKKAFSGQLVAQDPNDEPASVLLERSRAEKEAQFVKQPPKQKRRAT